MKVLKRSKVNIPTPRRHSKGVLTDVTLQSSPIQDAQWSYANGQRGGSPTARPWSLAAAFAIAVVVLAFAISIFNAQPVDAAAASQIKGGAEKALSSPASPVPTQVFADLSDKVVNSVVNISTKKVEKKRRHGRFRNDFDRFFGSPNGKRERFNSLGTGVVVDRKGDDLYILTNHHVIDDADEIQVHYAPRSKQPAARAEVVGRDTELDLALIRAKSSDPSISPLPLGDSEKLRVGEFVMAVGNPFGQGHSVSHGIISAKNRIAPTILGRYLQTDAPINPGNSGGPLVNLKGEIVGINNAILAHAQGIGFAIPANEIVKVLPQLKEDGKVTRGYIGISMGQIGERELRFVRSSDIEVGTPFVAGIQRNGPAHKAGLEENDIILAFNGKKVSTPEELLREVTSSSVGDHAQVQILRSGKKKSFDIKVVERPTL